MLMIFGTAAAASQKCTTDKILPDKSCTPGAAFSGDTGCGGKPCTKETFCVSGYSKTVRAVSTEEKQAVYESYGVPGYDHTGYCDGDGGCEVDHLISLEIGGSNDQANLWPQPYFGDWNAHTKDTLENKLKKLMCEGTITLQEAQDCISSDWKDCYGKHMGDPRVEMERYEKEMSLVGTEKVIVV